MLTLSRKVGESILIGTDIRVTVIRSGGGQTKLAIDAPQVVKIHRQGLLPSNYHSSYSIEMPG